MSCNNVQILNFNHNVVEIGSDNKLIITDNVKCNSITIPQPVTNILQINSPGPQGPAGVSVNTGSFVTTSSFNAYTGSSTSQFAGTSSFALTASYALNAGTTIDTGSFVTTSSFNVFTASYNTFSSSYNTGSFTGSFIGNLIGTASYATTASYVMGGGGSGAGFPYSGSAVITGSLLVSQSGLQVVGNQTITGSIIFNSGSRITSTYYGNTYPGYIDIVAGAPGGFVELLSYNSQSSFYVDDDGVSLLTSASYLWEFRNDGRLLAPRGIEASSFTGSLKGTADTASVAPNYLPLTGGTVTGNLTVNQNLYVLGTASIQEIQYVSQSSLNIGTNLITVNTATPAVRFGGLAVYDSGSTGTGRTGSILWDSQNDVWVYSNPSGAAYDGAMILVGPRNSTGIGNEVGINSGYAAVGNGSHHMTSSAIFSSGSLIRLENNTQVTGSLTVTGSTLITGSAGTLLQVGSNILFVSSSGNVGIGTTTPPASVALDVVGNIRSSTQLSSGQVRINYVQPNTQNLQFTSGSANSTVAATMFTGSGNWVYQAAQNATDLGYKIAINSSGISGSLYVSGSTLISGSLTVNGVSVAVIKERRQDFVYPFSYCGTAPSGSAEAATVWTIVRINMSGSTDTIGTATNVAWTNRYSATYI